MHDWVGCRARIVQTASPMSLSVPSHPPQAVVFDLGGVLIDWDPRYLYRKLFGTEAEVERFLATVATPQWNEAQDRGRPWAEAVDALTAQWPQYAQQIAAYDTRWLDTLGEAKHDTVQLLDALRQRGDVRLIALTNWSQEKFPLARPRFPFLEWFEGIVVSGEEGMAKPDAALFERMRTRYALTPAQTLFIDDSPVNVRAAAALGYQAVRFECADVLRRALQERGLLAATR